MYRRHTMQAQRRIYDHAPPTIPIPAEFQNSPLEVLFLRLNELGKTQTRTADSAYKQMKKILASKPAHLSALTLDTSGFKFNREEANVR